MPDQKPEAKQSGLLGIFRRKESASTSTHTPNNGRQEQRNTTAPRRAYKPRYAERDMVLSMPVGQRPDLVAKANEARLQGVCSDIGFSTTVSSRSMSTHSRIGSHNGPSRQMPTHPNLHLKLHGVSASSTAGSSASSFHDSVLQGSGVSRTASSPSSLRDMYSNAGQIEPTGRVLDQSRPGPRSHHSAAAVPQLDSTSMEAVNQAYAELGISGADFEPRTSTMDTRSGRAAQASQRLTATHATTRQRTSYWGHNDVLPNLRADKGKGKQGTWPAVAAPMGVAGSSDRCHAFDRDYFDDRESYILRTTAKPEAASRHAPSLPEVSPEHSPHEPESSSSSFAESFENRNANDFWARAESQRNPSTSTLMTSYTESSEVAQATVPSYRQDASTPKNNAGPTAPRRHEDSAEGHQEHEDSDDSDSEYNDETPDAQIK